MLSKKQGIFGSGHELTDDVLISINCLVTTSRFCQLCCEGHNIKFQNYFRSQAMNSSSGSINIVSLVYNYFSSVSFQNTYLCSLSFSLFKIGEILVDICENSFAVSRFQLAEVDLVKQLLATLVDFTQGPCSENQELIASSDVISALNSVIFAVIKKKI